MENKINKVPELANLEPFTADGKTLEGLDEKAFMNKVQSMSEKLNGIDASVTEYELLAKALVILSAKQKAGNFIGITDVQLIRLLLARIDVAVTARLNLTVGTLAAKGMREEVLTAGGYPVSSTKTGHDDDCACTRGHECDCGFEKNPGGPLAGVQQIR